MQFGEDVAEDTAALKSFVTRLQRALRVDSRPDGRCRWDRWDGAIRELVSPVIVSKSEQARTAWIGERVPNGRAMDRDPVAKN